MFEENGKPFTYLNTDGSEFIKMKDRVNYLLKNPKEMPIKIDYNEISNGFIVRNHDGCVDEYLGNYIAGRFLPHSEIDTFVNREVFYLIAREFLINFKANNDIVSLKLAVA